MMLISVAVCQRRLILGCDVYTDGLGCFEQFVVSGHARTTLTAMGRAATEIEGARWANIVLANIKRSISGAYHAFRQAKYERRNLAEAAYRFNRRFHLPHLLPTLLSEMATCAPCPERLIRKATNYSAEVRHQSGTAMVDTLSKTIESNVEHGMPAGLGPTECGLARNAHAEKCYWEMIEEVRKYGERY